MSIDGALTTSTMLLRSRPEVEEHAMVAELEVAVDEAHPPAEPWSAIAALIAIVVVPTPPLAP